MAREINYLLKGGVTIKRHYFIVGLLVPLIAILIGAMLLGGCSRKQNVDNSAAEKAKTVNPDAELAAIKIGKYARPGALMSVYELQEKLSKPEPGILIFDTRSRNMKTYQKTYLSGHIPGAIAILYSSFYNENYPGRLATPTQFQDVLGICGVRNDSCIILYGNDGLQTRLYWAIKMYGYENVRILDGSLDKWKEAGFDITNTPVKRSPQTFEFNLTNSKAELMLATIQEVEAAKGNPNYVIVDARHNDEYIKGHIPGSVNITWSELLDKDMTFKPASHLKQLFEDKEITPDKNIIVYSNVGVRSSMVWFALCELLGYPNVKNYDGSYNEWQKYERPVETNL